VDFRQPRRLFPNARAPVERRGSAERTGAVRNMRKPRSAGLVAAVHRIDATIDQATRDELARWIQGEYVNEIGDMPLGFVALCGLGPPYVDHILDLGHTIVNHYASADPMPEPFERARMLVRSGAYAYAEVYLTGTVVPVLADGSPIA
jgi:hypothetical protein